MFNCNVVDNSQDCDRTESGPADRSNGST